MKNVLLSVLWITSTLAGDKDCVQRWSYIRGNVLAKIMYTTPKACFEFCKSFDRCEAVAFSAITDSKPVMHCETYTFGFSVRSTLNFSQAATRDCFDKKPSKCPKSHPYAYYHGYYCCEASWDSCRNALITENSRSCGSGDAIAASCIRGEIINSGEPKGHPCPDRRCIDRYAPEIDTGNKKGGKMGPSALMIILIVVGCGIVLIIVVYHVWKNTGENCMRTSNHMTEEVTMDPNYIPLTHEVRMDQCDQTADPTPPAYDPTVHSSYDPTPPHYDEVLLHPAQDHGDGYGDAGGGGGFFGGDDCGGDGGDGDGGGD